MVNTISSLPAANLRPPVTALSTVNTQADVLGHNLTMRTNALQANDILRSDTTVSRVFKRVKTLIGGDDTSGSQLQALRRQLMNLTGDVAIQQALNHTNTQNADWMISMTAAYLDIGLLNTFRANMRMPRPQTLPHIDGSSQGLAGGRGIMPGVQPVGIPVHTTMSSAELTDKLLALMESLETWLLRERNLSEANIYRSTMLQHMHVDVETADKRKIAAAYETVRAFALANQPPDGPSLDMNFANLEEPQNIERLYQMITYIEKSYHTDKIFDYSDTDTGVTDGIAAIAEFKVLHKTLFADLQNLDKASLAVAEAQQIMSKVAQRYPANIHNQGADPRDQGAQLEAIASHKDEHHMIHILEACGETDINALVQKFDSYEGLLGCAEGIIRKKEFRAAADHANMFTDDQFLKVFLTYFAREKLFHARDERRNLEKKACGTKHDEFRRNLDKMHDGMRHRILSLTPPTFDAHGHIVQENDGRQLVELYRACPNLFYASQGSQTNNGEYTQMLCRLEAIALYEFPQLMANASHNSPVTLAQQIALDRMNQANASYQLYYQNMTSADQRVQHGWRDAVAERVTSTTRYTGMAARFLGKPAKLLGKTFETLTKGILYVADKTIHGVAHGIEHLSHHVDHLAEDHDNKQGLFTRVLLGIPCSILSAPLSIVNAGAKGVNAVREGVEKGVHAGYHGAIHALSHSDKVTSLSDALCVACEHLGHSTGGAMSKFTRWLYDHGTHHQKQEFVENFYRRLTPEQVANLRLGYEYTQMASGIVSAPTIMTDTDRIMSDNWAKAKKPTGSKEGNPANKMVVSIGESFERRYKNMRDKTNARSAALGTEESKDFANRMGVVCDLMLEFSDNFKKLKDKTPGSVDARLIVGEIRKNHSNSSKSAESYEEYFKKTAERIEGVSGPPATGIYSLQRNITQKRNAIARVAPIGSGFTAAMQAAQLKPLQDELNSLEAQVIKESKLRDAAKNSEQEFKTIKEEIENINKHVTPPLPAAPFNILEQFLGHMSSTGTAATVLESDLDEFLK